MKGRRKKKNQNYEDRMREKERGKNGRNRGFYRPRSEDPISKPWDSTVPDTAFDCD